MLFEVLSFIGAVATLCYFVEWQSEKNMARFWKQSNENNKTLIDQLQKSLGAAEDLNLRQSKEIADSYMERLKLERTLEHLATGPNAIIRDNIRLRNELARLNEVSIQKQLNVISTWV